MCVGCTSAKDKSKLHTEGGFQFEKLCERYLKQGSMQRKKTDICYYIYRLWMWLLVRWGCNFLNTWKSDLNCSWKSERIFSTGCGCSRRSGGSCNKKPKHLEEPQVKVHRWKTCEIKLRKGKSLEAKRVQYSQVESGSEALSSLSISKRTPTSNSTTLDHCG